MIEPSAGTEAAALERRADTHRSIEAAHRTSAGAAASPTPPGAARPRHARADAAPPATGPDFALSLSAKSRRLAAGALTSASAPSESASSADSTSAAWAAEIVPAASRSTSAASAETVRDEDPVAAPVATRSLERRERSDRVVDAYRAVQKASVGAHVRVVA
ncbi:MAG: hypothetical protein R3F35_23180 [Myxococcota bacterium]